MLKFQTYADNVRMAAKTRDNSEGRPLTIREIAERVGVSYEAIRKIWMSDQQDAGRLSLSRLTNDELCRVLNLPAEEMWAVAQREKVAHKVGYVPMQLVKDREGRELSRLWPELSPDERQVILKVAKGFTSREDPDVRRSHQHSAAV